MRFIARKTITATFLSRARETPKLPAYLRKSGLKWETVTFGEFFAQCRELSFGLMSLGLEPGEKVALLSSTRYEWSLSDMAILGARAVTVPIYPSITAEEIAFILNHSETAIAIVENAAQLRKIQEQRSANPQALSHLRKIIVIDPTGSTEPNTLSLAELRRKGQLEEARDPQKFERHLLEARPEDLFTICYTSGTTGDPKGVMLTHDSLMSVLEDCLQLLGEFVRPDQESTLSFLPYAHILGRVESMAIYVFGWRAAFAESAEKVSANFREIRPTVVFTVPRVFEKAFDRITEAVNERPATLRKLFSWALNRGKAYYGAIWSGKRPALTDLAQYQLASKLIFDRVREGFGGRLSCAICGGAPLPKEVGEFFQIAGIPILEGYGLTESCAPVALNSLRDLRFGTVGRPLPEVSLRIADDGEILVKSRKVFLGYYKAPEDTAEAIRSGWFHTGDLGFIDNDGFLHVTDRKKDLIVTSSGKSIAPQKIESLAMAHRLISHFVVHGDRRNYLTALITLNQEEAIKLANEQQILFSEYRELVKHSKILAIVQRIVSDINHQLASFETIKKYIILPEEFTVESSELTPSLKIRRKVIAERYRKELDSMYKQVGGRGPWVS